MFHHLPLAAKTWHARPDQLNLFLVREKHTRLNLKYRLARVPARARILTCVLAWALASAVPDGLGSSPSTQSGTGLDQS